MGAFLCVKVLYCYFNLSDIYFFKINVYIFSIITVDLQCIVRFIYNIIQPLLKSLNLFNNTT